MNQRSQSTRNEFGLEFAGWLALWRDRDRQRSGWPLAQLRPIASVYN